MDFFKSCLKLELRRWTIKWKLMVLLVIWCIAMVFIQTGASEFKNVLAQKQTFRAAEKAKAENMINYRLYGVYGIRMLFVPAVHSIFMNDSGVLPGMMSFVDSGERLQIYYPLTGKNAFEMGKKRSVFSDFSGILLFFVTLLSLAYGYEAFCRENYLKLLVSRYKSKQVRFSILVSRLIVLFLMVLVFFVSALLLIWINGLSAQPDIHILALLLKLFLAAAFFFVLGMVFSTFKSKIIGIIAPVITWFILLFVIPPIISTIVAQTARHITPVQKLELNKFKIFMDWEKQSTEKYGALKIGTEITDNDRDIVNEYLNKEFKSIEGLEARMLSEMESHILLSQWLCELFPTTSYQSAANELSSRGYENLVDHYKYVVDFKEKFVLYILENVYFDNFSEVKPFIKKEENIFYARPRLPRPFLFGMLFHLVLILGLVYLFFHRHNTILYCEPQKDSPPSKYPPIKLEKGSFKIIRVAGLDFVHRLFNLLSGHKTAKNLQGFENKLFIDGQDIVTLTGKQDFLFVGSWNSLPLDSKVKDYTAFIKEIAGTSQSGTKTPLNDIPLPDPLHSKQNKTILELPPHERCLLLLHTTEMFKCDIYVFDEITRCMPRSIYVRLKDLMTRLAQEGRKCLCLSSMLSDPPDEPGTQDFFENIMWERIVEEFRAELLKRQSKTAGDG